MDDVEVQVGEFACTFRRRLLSEHLGLTEEEVEDPLDDDFIERMNQMAQVKFASLKIIKFIAKYRNL